MWSSVNITALRAALRAIVSQYELTKKIISWAIHASSFGHGINAALMPIWQTTRLIKIARLDLHLAWMKRQLVVFSSTMEKWLERVWTILIDRWTYVEILLIFSQSYGICRLFAYTASYLCILCIICPLRHKYSLWAVRRDIIVNTSHWHASRRLAMQNL